MTLTIQRRRGDETPIGVSQAFERDVLEDLWKVVRKSAAIYQAVADRTTTPLLQAMCRRRAVERLALCARLQARSAALVAARSGRPLAAPSDDHGLAGASDDAALVAELERREASLRKRLSQALARGPFSPASDDLLRSASSTITADHRDVRDLNLILH